MNELKERVAKLSEGKYAFKHVTHRDFAWPIIEKSQLLARISEMNSISDVNYTASTTEFIGPFIYLYLGNPRQETEHPIVGGNFRNPMDNISGGENGT